MAPIARSRPANAPESHPFPDPRGRIAPPSPSFRDLRGIRTRPRIPIPKDPHRKWRNGSYNMPLRSKNEDDGEAILPLRSRIDGDTASLHGTRSRGIGMAPRQTHRQRLCRIKKPDAGANPGIRSSNAPIRPADDPPRSTDPTNPGGRDRCPRRPRCARAARGSSCRRPPGCWPGGAVSTRTRSRPC